MCYAMGMRHEPNLFDPADDDAEARVAEGGWYRRDETYTLYYRPSGHADEFLTAWLETSASDNLPAAQAIFTQLSAPQAPGACMKCHTVDRVGNTSLVNWLTLGTTGGCR